MAAAAQASAQPPPARRTVVILTGPTAVGKTAASLKLAHVLNGEIISADSVQVYRGLDIGSAKLPEHQRQGIPHHLIDVADPADDFSAGEFYGQARALTEDILQRGKTPIVVGGTGFYLRWYIYGKPNTPISSPELAAAAQAKLNEAWAAAAAAQGSDLTPQQKWHTGVELVAALGDPQSAERLQAIPNDYYRLLRVLEIVITTGRPRAELDLDTAAPLAYDFQCFFLQRPRAALYRRIDVRCEEMLRDGILRECMQLLRAGFQPDSCSATRAIGYRQGLEALLRWRADPDSLVPQSMSRTSHQNSVSYRDNMLELELVAAVQSGSRQYCHQQLKWARGVELFRWLDATKPTTDIVADIHSHMQGKPYTGGSGQNGLLTKEEAQQMRQYQAQLQLLSDPAALEQLCADTRALLSEQPA